MEVLKVIDNPNLVRAKDSKAILNTNTEELNKYKEEREQRLKLKHVTESYDKLQSDVEEIKGLLHKLLGSIDK